jgi:hypothetical protein
MSNPSTRTHSVPRTFLRGAAIALIALAVVAGPAFAGKSAGGGKTPGAVVKVDNGAFGGTTTAYAGPASATWVRALCYQGGRLVYEQYRVFDSSRRATLQLGPTPSWSGGAATCTAQDGYWRNGSTWRVTSTSSFSVSG